MMTGGSKVHVQRMMINLFQKLYNNILISKGGKSISPFLFVILFYSLGLSQFQISHWTHPGILVSDTTKINQIHFYTNNDINFISKSDSTKVYTSLSGLKIYFPMNESLELKMDIYHKKYRTRFVHELLQIDAHEHYKGLNYHLIYKKNKSFIPSLFLSPLTQSIGSDVNFLLRNGIAIQTGYFIHKKAFDTKIAYEDFLYNVNNVEKIQHLHTFRLKHKINNVAITINDQSSFYNINQQDSNNDKIDSPYYKDDLSSIQLIINNQNKSKIFIEHKRRKKDFALHFIQNNNPFLKLNKVYFLSSQTKLSIHNNQVELGFLHRESDLILSSRIKASMIGNSLETILGAAFVNNLDEGHITIDKLFINYKKNINNHTFKFHIGYTIDRYNIDIRNSLYTASSFFIAPFDITYDFLQYKRKTAVIFGFEDSIQFKKIIFNMKFYQNIPIKIYKWIEDDPEKPDFNNMVNYGLGQFLFNIFIPLD